MKSLTALRSAMVELGLAAVPIDVTEVGWPTMGILSTTPPMPDATRAQAYTALTQALPGSGCGVERFVPHTWVTKEHNVLSTDDWYGITHPNGSPSKTANAYAAAIASVHAGTAPTSTLPACG